MQNADKLHKIIAKAHSLDKGKELAYAEEFISLDEKIDAKFDSVKESVNSISEELKKKLDEELSYEVDEESIVESVLSKVVIPEPIPGQPGKDGDKYILTEKDKKEIAGTIKVPIVEKIIDRIEVIKEQPIVTNEIKEVAIADTAEVTILKINELPTDDEELKIDAKHIKNLPKIEKQLGTGTKLLNQLQDVAVGGVTNGQTLVWNSTLGMWEAETPSGGGIPPTSNPYEILFVNAAGDALDSSSNMVFNKATNKFTLYSFGANRTFEVDSDSLVILQGDIDAISSGYTIKQDLAFETWESGYAVLDTFNPTYTLNGNGKVSVYGADAISDLDILVGDNGFFEKVSLAGGGTNTISLTGGVLNIVGTGATQQLDNLREVAVNDHIIPDRNDGLDLGSTDLAWGVGYINQLLATGDGTPTTTTVAASSSSTKIANTEYVMNTLYDQRKKGIRTGFQFFTDFTQEPSTTGTDNSIGEINSGGSTTLQTTTLSNQVGLVRSTTATTATGRAGLASGAAILLFGGGEWFFEIENAITTLSDGTNRFTYLAGFIDTFTTPNIVDGVFFLYDEGGVSTGSTASPNWQIVTASNNTRTFTTTSVAVTTRFQRLTIEVNAAGTSAEFFIDGTLVGTHTTNIPTGAGRQTGYGTNIIKSIGTTARTVDIDYINVVSKFTASR